MMLPRPCVDCGVVVRAARCINCNRVRERKRPSRLDRGYDAEWRKLSKAARDAQPWCSICKSTKDLTADHIQALADVIDEFADAYADDRIDNENLEKAF